MAEALKAEGGVPSAECGDGEGMRDTGCGMQDGEAAKKKGARADFMGWDGARRRGKVGRLPAELREELNVRLENGEEAKPLLVWLNGLPEVKELLAEQFAGCPISKQNLSEWRQGGFREWLVRQQLSEQAEGLELCAAGIEAQSEGLLVDNLATVVAARYAGLLADWDGEPGEAFEGRARVLRGLCHDVVRLQRSMHRAAEQSLKLEELLAAQSAREEQQAKARALAPILSAMRNRSLAEALGGGESAEQVAGLINAVQHDVPVAEDGKFKVQSSKVLAHGHREQSSKFQVQSSKSPEGISDPESRSVKPSQT